ncbi:unnamed protein product [Sphenostylis stenocarpa]|uniref:Serine-threonine/tyrosine-protein kinase catalytic domain-containing protein n=1 Tax=Sphenostylis stenocarpa TaxID=92480 RepID=A0AA86W4X5_9FABA|nr:unnamed protein product [Sphenostylis stenocarpa]
MVVALKDKKKMLVYEYMANGSLDSFIFGMNNQQSKDLVAISRLLIDDSIGYTAPEYAVDGLFSVKSDVFSFGILVLEMVCGKKNRRLYQTDKNLNLVGHARLQSVLNLPAMASVILMLESRMELVKPKEPGFITKNVSVEEELYSNEKYTSPSNDVTVSMLEAR